MKTILIIIYCFTYIATSSAQLEKTIHQTFEIGDASSLHIRLSGEVEINPWAGNSVMTKTIVYLFDASPAILSHLIEKEKRYLIESEVVDANIIIKSKLQERKPVHTRSGVCPERVIVHVYLPDSFAASDSTNTSFVRTIKQ